MTAQGRQTDFRATTVWIYIAMFATLALMNWHRQPLMKWLDVAAVTLLLPAAVAYRVRMWLDGRLQGKG